MSHTHLLSQLCLFVVVCGVLGTPALAQKKPYDVRPDAKPPYYRVRYEASTEPGKLIFPVQYTVWIPANVKTLRGVVVHQHGCGEGSCKSGLTGAFDLHWQALASAHGCALLSPSYEQPQDADCQMWCDPRNGSGDAFQKALVDLGKESGHPELASVPWALWGHSGGGHWAGGMVMLHPKRVAAAWLRSGVPLYEANPDRPSIKPHVWPTDASQVPIMCNLGTKEGVTVTDGRFAKVWPANEAFFYPTRAQGGLIGIAVDPLTAHECGNQRYLAIPWLSECLAERLPRQTDQTESTKDAVQTLRPMPTNDIWLADVLGDKAVAAADYQGDPAKAVWLPNESIAKRWMQYGKDSEVADASPPPAPQSVTANRNEAGNGNVVRWSATADLESGIGHFIIRRDGKYLAKVPAKPQNRYGRVLFQNLLYSDTPTQPLAAMEFTDTTAGADEQHVYQVITVNTVGAKSKPSTTVD